MPINIPENISGFVFRGGELVPQKDAELTTSFSHEVYYPEIQPDFDAENFYTQQAGLQKRITSVLSNLQSEKSDALEFRTTRSRLSNIFFDLVGITQEATVVFTDTTVGNLGQMFVTPANWFHDTRSQFYLDMFSLKRKSFSRRDDSAVTREIKNVNLEECIDPDKTLVTSWFTLVNKEVARDQNTQLAIYQQDGRPKLDDDSASMISFVADFPAKLLDPLNKTPYASFEQSKSLVSQMIVRNNTEGRNYQKGYSTSQCFQPGDLFSRYGIDSFRSRVPDFDQIKTAINWRSINHHNAVTMNMWSRELKGSKPNVIIDYPDQPRNILPYWHSVRLLRAITAEGLELGVDVVEGRRSFSDIYNFNDNLDQDPRLKLL